MATFLDLPEELLSKVLAKLDGKSLLAAEQVRATFFDVSLNKDGPDMSQFL
jgi:hypothetical protein